MSWTPNLYCWQLLCTGQLALQEFKFQCESKLKPCFSPQFPPFSVNSEWLHVTVQCDMGSAAAVMAWSSTDCGFVKIHMTTEAPSIPR